MFGFFSSKAISHEDAIEAVSTGIREDGYEGGMKVAIDKASRVTDAKVSAKSLFEDGVERRQSSKCKSR
jgi:hypothetical protein